MSTETDQLPPIALLMNSDKPPLLKNVLRGISRRPDEHCQLAWNYLDTVAPGELMDIITGLTQDGRSGPFVFRHCAKAFQKGTDPRFRELVALAVEFSVRKNKA